MKLKIGSRGSHLALAQSYYIRDRLNAEAGVEAEIIIIKTSGDRIQNVPLSSIGDTPAERKGFFTKELEDALLNGDIDLAVHSFKDLPTQDPPGLIVSAMPQRVSPGDVLLIPREKKAGDEPPYLEAGASIGTSSVRRSAQINMLWPSLKCVNIRGNVPTRIEKLRLGLSEKPESEVPAEKIDAIMLARAGLDRLRATGLFDAGGEHAGLLDGLEILELAPDDFIPAPAQGALALQCREDDARVREICNQLHEGETAACVELERGVLAGLEGGCHLPLGTHGRALDEGFVLDVFLGREAEDNRRGDSFQARRMGASAPELSARFLREMKTGLPLVLTGREDRVREILERRENNQAGKTDGGADIRGLPMIRLAPAEPDPESLPGLREWLKSGLAEPRQGVPNLVAAFSVPGTRALAEYISREYPDVNRRELVWDFLVTAERTAEAVREFFPASRIAVKSPDGTGEGLARHLLGFPPVRYDPCASHVLATSAEYGRPEFREILREACVQVTTLTLYKTEEVVPSETDVAALPSGACLIFGSPSAVRAYGDFLGSSAGAEAKARDFCYGALGPTTEKALREIGLDVYARATVPDYEAFIDELS